MGRISVWSILPAVLLVFGAAYQQYHAYQYFLNEDEGAYAYAAWRISLGQVPYRDFFSSQPPLSLYWGGLLVHLFGRSYVPLRLSSGLVTLLAAWLLYVANREVFGRGLAILSLALFLVESNVFNGARFFLSEAYMLLFELAGLYAFVLGEKRKRLAHIGLAGVFFALSTLSKLFGALPLVGCLLYLLYAWRRERRAPGHVLREGAALALPALLLVGVTALIFTRITPHFLTALVGHHTMQGAGMPLLDRVSKAVALYCSYVTSQPLAVALAAVGGWLALRRKQALPSVLLWLAPTALGFAVLSRGVWLRHLAYLAPTLVTFAAAAIVDILSVLRRLPQRPLWRMGGLMLAAVLALLASGPWLAGNAMDAAKAEQDSPHLSALIQRLSSNDQLVISDQPGLAFLAGRASTYWAAEMSGVAAQSGEVRGAQLADEIERHDVAVIVIRTDKGGSHIVKMRDYPDFMRYVRSRYSLVEEYVCGYRSQVFKVYARCELLAAGCAANPAAPATLFGGSIELRLPGCPADVCQRLWTVMQWQDGTGAWHDVEGWQGPPEVAPEGGVHKHWVVSPDDLGKGPFRWVVLRGRGGEMLAASQPFRLPALSGDVTEIDLAVSC